MSVSRAYEQVLSREGLAALDFDDGAGGIAVGNRGSGKLLDSGRAFARASASAEVDARRSLLGARRYKRGERRIVQMYSLGLSTRVIARRTGKGRMAVYRLIMRVKRRLRSTPEQRLGELLRGCEPTTIVLVFALLERALESPGAIRTMIGRARAIPELRAILEPDEYRRPIEPSDGNRRFGALNPGNANGWGDGTGDGRYNGTMGAGGRVGDAQRSEINGRKRDRHSPIPGARRG